MINHGGQKMTEKQLEVVINKDGTIAHYDPVTLKNKKIIRSHKDMSDIEQMGFFGNIWVRSHYFAKAGDTNGEGHRHHFDHVTLLAVGSVLVEMDDHEPKEFHGPTFIVIDKDHKHKFTALTDGVVYYCVFAVRDIDGEVSDLYSEDNSPSPPKFTSHISDEEWLKLKQEKE
jgi:hypothetical protein